MRRVPGRSLLEGLVLVGLVLLAGALPAVAVTTETDTAADLENPFNELEDQNNGGDVADLGLVPGLAAKLTPVRKHGSSWLDKIKGALPPELQEDDDSDIDVSDLDNVGDEDAPANGDDDESEDSADAFPAQPDLTEAPATKPRGKQHKKHARGKHGEKRSPGTHPGRRGAGHAPEKSSAGTSPSAEHHKAASHGHHVKESKQFTQKDKAQKGGGKNFDDDIEEGVDEAADATEEGIDEAGSAVEEGVDEAGSAVEEGADAVAEGAEHVGSEVESGVDEAAEATHGAMGDAAASLESAGDEVEAGVDEAGDAIHDGVHGKDDDHTSDQGEDHDATSDSEDSVDEIVDHPEDAGDAVVGSMDDSGHETRKNIRKASGKVARGEKRIEAGLEANNEEVADGVTDELEATGAVTDKKLEDMAESEGELAAKGGVAVEKASEQIENVYDGADDFVEETGAKLNEINKYGAVLEKKNKEVGRGQEELDSGLEEEDDKIKAVAGQGDRLSSKVEANEQHIEDMQNDLKDIIENIQRNSVIRQLKDYGNSEEDKVFEKLQGARHPHEDVDPETARLRKIQAIAYGDKPKPHIPTPKEETDQKMKQVVPDAALPGAQDHVVVQRPETPEDTEQRRLEAGRRQLADKRQALAAQRATILATKDPAEKKAEQKKYSKELESYDALKASYDTGDVATAQEKTASTKGAAAGIPGASPHPSTSKAPGAGGAPVDPDQAAIHAATLELDEIRRHRKKRKEESEHKIKAKVREVTNAKHVLTNNVLRAIRDVAKIPKHARFNGTLRRSIGATIDKLLKTPALQKSLGVGANSYSLGTLAVPGSGSFQVIVDKQHRATLRPVQTASNGTHKKDKAMVAVNALKAKLKRSKNRLAKERRQAESIGQGLYAAMDELSTELAAEMAPPTMDIGLPPYGVPMMAGVQPTGMMIPGTNGIISSGYQYTPPARQPHHPPHRVGQWSRRRQGRMAGPGARRRVPRPLEREGYLGQPEPVQRVAVNAYGGMVQAPMPPMWTPANGYLQQPVPLAVGPYGDMPMSGSPAQMYQPAVPQFSQPRWAPPAVRALRRVRARRQRMARRPARWQQRRRMPMRRRRATVRGGYKE